MLLITLLGSLLTSLVFGLVPAFVTARQDLIECLKTGVAVADPRQRRLSGVLVVAEIALAVALLTGSGLLSSHRHSAAARTAIQRSGNDAAAEHGNHQSPRTASHQS